MHPLLSSRALTKLVDSVTNCSVVNNVNCREIRTPPFVLNVPEDGRNLGAPIVGVKSALVDLDGGGTVKGNLINVDPDPENVDFGMKVKVIFDDALGRKDSEGNSYLSYFFEPA